MALGRIWDEAAHVLMILNVIPLLELDPRVTAIVMRRDPKEIRGNNEL